MCSQDHHRFSFFVAGTIFGDVGGWVLLLRSLYWTFHVWRGSIMRVFFRGRRNTWWRCNQVAHWFCVAGIVFGKVGASFFVAGALFGEISNDSRSTTCCIYHTTCARWARKVTSVVGRVVDWRVRSRIILGSAAHWKWHFSRFQKFPLIFWSVFFVAGAVFGDVGGWLLLLRAM